MKKTVKELIREYNIDVKSLKQEQLRLAKQLEIKDSKDFSNVQFIAGIENISIANKVISGAIIMNSNLEILENNYFSDKSKFPYIPGFRAYRELPIMLEAFNKIEEKPEVVLIKAHGISHPRLGLASHFSIATQIPSIGVAEKLLEGEVCGEDIILNGKCVGKVLKSREGSKPLYVSPGNLISIESALKLAKRFINPPHKLPEPLHLAHRYVKKIQKELMQRKPKKSGV